LFEKPDEPSYNAISALRLIPIDHGYCLPHILSLSDVHFAWQEWDQAKEPILPEVKQYIAELDVESDISRIQQIVGAAIPESSLLTLRVCTMLLQKGVDAGLNLHEIGACMIPEMSSTNLFSPLQLAVNVAVHRATQKELRKSLMKQSPYQMFRNASFSCDTNFQSAADVSMKSTHLDSRARFSVLSRLSSAAVVVATSSANATTDLSQVENVADEKVEVAANPQSCYVSDDMLRFAITSSNGAALIEELMMSVDELIQSKKKEITGVKN
jgi:hypothetical protein